MERDSNKLSNLLKKEYGKLYGAVEEILFWTDIMGIYPVMNDSFNEYSGEVDRILPQLENATSEKDVLSIVLNTFFETFNRINLMAREEYCSVFEEYENSPKELRHKYDLAAKEIWEVWSRYPTNERCIKIK